MERRGREEGQGADEVLQQRRETMMKEEEEEEFRRVVRQPEEQRKQGQKEARVACYPYEKALHDCYATKWFPMVTCQDENEAFWNCYKEKRGFLKSKLELWREQQADKVSAAASSPPTHQPPPSSNRSSKQ